MLIVNNERTVEAGGQAAPSIPSKQVAKPVWQQLDRVVEVSHRRSPVVQEPLALGFELHRPPDRRYFQPNTPARLKVSEVLDESDPQLHIRPLVPGAKSNWIKGQAGRHWFTSRSNDYRFDSDQFEWFYRLATLDDSLGLPGYSSATTIRLDSFGSPFLWDLLAQAVELDILLVSTDK